MLRHTMLVSAEDAVSAAAARADGLAGLCFGMAEAAAGEAEEWRVLEEALRKLGGDLRAAQGTLGRLHEESWRRADKDPEAREEALAWAGALPGAKGA